MHIIIIGNGISGITAARHIRKLSDYRITVVSKETEYFFSRTALMYVYVGHMKFEHTKPYEDWFWKKNRIELVFDEVQQIDTPQKTITLASGKQIQFDKLIIASGSQPNKLDCPGSELKGVQGLYSKQDLDNMEICTKDIKSAVVAGGGLIGIEMAEMLLSRKIHVTFLIREKNYSDSVLPEAEASMISNHIRKHHIDLRTETNITEILGDENGRVRAVTTDRGHTIDCQFTGMTVGVSPNIHFFQNSGIECHRGILVNEYLETSAPGVFAIGDCAEFRWPLPNRRPVEQFWYTGRMMGETVAKSITGERTAYTPGIWFNSAKFLDIEYQTYGWIFPELQPGEASFYWQHHEENICLRINYRKDSQNIVGIHAFGMRLRHTTLDRWIQEKRTIQFVLEHLPEANFDPEFCRQHEKQIISQFNDENGGTQSLIRSRRGLFQKNKV